MSALPTLPARPAPAPGRARRPPLSLVPPLARSRAPKAPFVALVLLLLAAGLVSLLLLNTVLAQDAFRLHDLQRRAAALGDQERTLARDLDARSDPSALADRARRLGMVPGGDPRFLPPGAPPPKDARVEGGVVVVPGPPPPPPAAAPGIAPGTAIPPGTAVPPRAPAAPSAAAGAADPSRPPAAQPGRPAAVPGNGTRPGPGATGPAG